MSAVNGSGTQSRRVFPKAGGIRLTIVKGDKTMLESIAILLLILWLLGLVSSYTLGGFIHILLVIAVVVIVLRVIQGRRVL
jgi:hypothetical protein